MINEKLTDKANTICLYRILADHSDEEHVLTMRDIMALFDSEYGMKIDRRTVYSSIETLQKLGYDVSDYEENRRGYYLRTRLFEPSEVRLMMDAVYSLNSIPQKQTMDLIEKLQSTCSNHQKKLYRHLFVSEPEKKTPNRSVFFNIDILETAIADAKKVEFTYMQYGLDKRLHPRRKEKYVVSPYSMVCDNKKYYLLCMKEGKQNLSFYRIDLMKDIRMLELPVDVAPSKMDLSTARKTIYAFAGKPVDIVLRCANSVIGGVVDQFGSGVKIETRSDGHFLARVKAAPQGVLYWTMQYLGEVEILEPAEMRKSAIEMIKSNPYGV
ncbi:MAG: WYL domain-containing protein [Clostridia bacterium]|nr:WYL domain-containing protein [Clostridia bacterium]